MICFALMDDDSILDPVRCQKCFISSRELVADKEHSEALYICFTGYCVDCVPKDIARTLNQKLSRVFHPPH